MLLTNDEEEKFQWIKDQMNTAPAVQLEFEPKPLSHENIQLLGTDRPKSSG